MGRLNARQQLRTRQNQVVTFGGISLEVSNIKAAGVGDKARVRHLKSRTPGACSIPSFDRNTEASVPLLISRENQ